MSQKFSTDQFSATKFRPHGRIEYEILNQSEQLIHIKCYGPFNQEVMTAAKEIQNNPKLLSPKRKEIIEFVDNCMGISEFFLESRKYALEHKEKGLAPKAIALVMPPDIEGRSLMLDDYLAVYENANIPVIAEESVDLALAWLSKF